MVCASRPAARLLRTAAPFELPGGYFGTTRPIIRLVVDPIIRVVLYYQPKADNPADNPAVSFVVWRQVGAASVEAAVAIYSTRYRSHWGAELALQGARLRFSRAYLAAQAPTCQAGMTFGTSSIGFDPADSAQYAAEAAPILGGPPRGQDRY